MKYLSLLAVVLLAGCGRAPSPAAPVTCQGEFCYQVVEGLVQVEGDIVIATERDLGARSGFAVTPTVTWARWPRGIVPYAVDPKLPNPERVTRALEHFESKTNVRFRKRTTQTSYVLFKPWSRGWCRSWIGRTGSAQAIDLDPVCDTRAVIHEIGHAVGMWHEHTRPDRDQFVKVFPQNAVTGTASNFTKQLTYGQKLGPYDFASVMHYRWWEMSAVGRPTITRLDGSTEGLSNPDGLSAGDVSALKTMYPVPPQ